MITCTVCGSKLADSDKGRAFHMKRYHGIRDLSVVEKPIDPKPLTKAQHQAIVAKAEAKFSSAIIGPDNSPKKNIPEVNQQVVLERLLDTLSQLDKSLMRLNDTIMHTKRYD